MKAWPVVYAIGLGSFYIYTFNVNIWDFFHGMYLFYGPFMCVVLIFLLIQLGSVYPRLELVII